MKPQLRQLLRMLDDESEQVASLAMAELIEKDSAGSLDKLLRRLQETTDQRLRRRVHQLQSAMLLRRRRRLLAKDFESQSLGLLEGLVGIHLLWYDNDSNESILKQWTSFMDESRSFRPTTIEQLAFFMKKKGFTCPAKDDIEPDSLCLGTVLDECSGADFILASIAKLLAASWGLQLCMTQIAGDFMLVSSDGQAIHPSNDWRIIPSLRRTKFKVWDTPMTLRLITSMLFLCAVNSDSFRYVFTIGSCLSKSFKKDGLDFLPHPYAPQIPTSNDDQKTD